MARPTRDTPEDVIERLIARSHSEDTGRLDDSDEFRTSALRILREWGID
jgi:hypothetical protein